MPVNGNNLHTYKSLFLFVMEQRYTPESSHRFPDSLIFMLLRDAERWLQDEFNLLQSVDDDEVLSATTFRYSMPVDVFSRKIENVSVKPSNAENWIPLDRRNSVEALQPYDILGDNPVKNTPRVWMIDPNDSRKILLAPVPDKDGLIRYHYNALPDPLRRIWNPGTVSTATTDGSADVAVTVAPTAAQCVAPDHFGVKATTQSDGVSLSKGEVVTWYKIASIVATTITLAEKFEGANGADQQFITAQVSDLEVAFPGKIGLTIAKHAAGEALGLHHETAQAGMLLKGDARAQWLSFSVDDAKETAPGKVAASKMPYHA